MKKKTFRVLGIEFYLTMVNSILIKVIIVNSKKEKEKQLFMLSTLSMNNVDIKV